VVGHDECQEILFARQCPAALVTVICWQLPTHKSKSTRHHLDVSTDIRVRLGSRIRALRLKHGWTQVELSEMLGVDRSYLSEIETGKKDPSLRVLKTIADGFNLSLSQLLRGL
jgi:DNA-binding XRE family transcriptional regulator